MTTIVEQVKAFYVLHQQLLQLARDYFLLFQRTADVSNVEIELLETGTHFYVSRTWYQWGDANHESVTLPTEWLVDDEWQSKALEKHKADVEAARLERIASLEHSNQIRLQSERDQYNRLKAKFEV